VRGGDLRVRRPVLGDRHRRDAGGARVLRLDPAPVVAGVLGGATALATLSGRNESIITASSFVHFWPMLAS
jgi:hypothetical protein